MSVDPFTNSRSDYACEPKELGQGGFARAFAATHKPSGLQVVLKSLMASPTDESRQRLRREVDVMRQLAGHPHVMPVLAADPNHQWYVMPRADGSLITLLPEVRTDEDRRDVILAVAKGLAAAHQVGVVHRDVTPGNVLRMPGGTWVLADFGLVRRPPGQTTQLLTKIGGSFGTQGFVAPELLLDPHAEATAASDVYGLARVLQFSVDGVAPLAGSTDPGASAFRRAIRDAIKADPDQRSSLPEFVAALEVALTPMPSQGPSVEELSRAAATGDRGAARALLQLALERKSDGDLYLDEVAAIEDGALQAELKTLEPGEFRELVTTMVRHIGDSFGYRNFDYLNTLVFWLQKAAEAARQTGDILLFEDVAEQFLDTDQRMDRYRQKDRSMRWLYGLAGEQASVVARLIFEDDQRRSYYADAYPPPRTDSAIADVLKSGAST